MTRDDIIRMAREATKYADKHAPRYVTVPNKWQEIRDARFANLVAAAEREACAKVCENIEEWQGEGSLELDPYYSDTYAAAIRARSKA